MASKILVIEDEESILKMLESVLKEAGFEVATATNGKVGLEKVSEFKPDLIFLDILMPVMNGFEVLKNLKVDDHGQNIPVIVLSNLGEESYERKAKALGADDFLVKTGVHLSDILDKVKKVLKQKK